MPNSIPWHKQAGWLSPAETYDWDGEDGELVAADKEELQLPRAIAAAPPEPQAPFENVSHLLPPITVCRRLGTKDPCC